MPSPVTFYSRYKSYKLAGAPGVGTIDFSGGKTPPSPGDGYFSTDDQELIRWLRTHDAYGIDFQETPYVPGVTSPDPRDRILALLIDSIEFV